jgi:hypothetical protein
MKIYNIINIPKGLSQEIECDCREEYNSGYTEGLEEGFDKGYDSGYTDGAESVDCEDFYDSGYTDGYESGYTSGYTDGQESVDCTDFYNSGVMTDTQADTRVVGQTDMTTAGNLAMTAVLLMVVRPDMTAAIHLVIRTATKKDMIRVIPTVLRLDMTAEGLTDTTKAMHQVLWTVKQPRRRS